MLLRNGLQLSNEEDLNQLMAVSLMLMAKNCAGLGEYHDVTKVAKTAYDLAEKIPDQTLQAAALNSLSGSSTALYPRRFCSWGVIVKIMSMFSQPFFFRKIWKFSVFSGDIKALH